MRDSAQYFKSAVLMESIQEALLGSKLHNAWKTSKAEILTVDKLASTTGRLAGEGSPYEE